MISIATMYWPHLFLLTPITPISTWVSLSLFSLVIPLVLSSFWYLASSFQQCLVFCPAGHTNFGVCQWEPASVVWHVGSYSHTRRERIAGLRGAPAISSGSRGKGSTAVILWNPNQNGNGRQSGAWGVMFPLSGKFALLTFGKHTLACYQEDLCISLWICKKHIFGSPQKCFMGSFYVLCKVGVGPPVYCFLSCQQ